MMMVLTRAGVHEVEGGTKVPARAGVHEVDMSTMVPRRSREPSWRSTRASRSTETTEMARGLGAGGTRLVHDGDAGEVHGDPEAVYAGCST
jgi:hypothetical protein